MKFFQSLLPAAGLLAVANASYGQNYTVPVPAPVPVTTTVVTTNYVTWCPYATTFIHHNVTYTATEACSLTLTNCPCEVATHYPPPVVTTDHDTTVTYTQPPVTVIADCTPVGPDGKPTPTHGYPVPSQPAPAPVSSQPGQQTTTHAPAPPATSGPVQVSPNGAEKVGTGFGVALAGLVAALL